MLAEKKRTKLYLIGIGIVVLVVIGLVIWHGVGAKDTSVPVVTPRPTPEVVIREKQVEKVITAEILQDGLRDMGVLVTQEYYFTEVISFSKIRKLFNISLPFTESSYLASYDGVVTAGVDLSTAAVEKDDQTGIITVTLPPAAVLNVDIDPDSFWLYDEKNGLGNPISAEEFNASLVELEKTAEQKALERGLTDKAGESAQTVIRNFIGSLVDMDKYAVRFVTGEA